MTKKYGMTTTTPSKGGKAKNLEAPDQRLILRAKYMVFWLTVQDNTVTGTVLAATEFRDFCVHVTMFPSLNI